jgi:hypothetical protein
MKQARRSVMGLPQGIISCPDRSIITGKEKMRGPAAVWREKDRFTGGLLPGISANAWAMALINLVMIRRV